MVRIGDSWLKPCAFAVAVILLAAASGGAVAGEDENPKALAEEVLRSAGVPGGLCVHLGCGGGALTAELAASGKFLVHGLDADAANVEKAQRRIRSRGLYGLAWAEERRTFAELPYAENLANLIVMDDIPEGTGPPLKEVMRVLCPNGVAYLGQSESAAKRGVRLDPDKFERKFSALGIEGLQVIPRQGVWARIQKPWPDEMDDWTHPRHGPDGNAASRDQLVGPPRRVRWVAGPWHEASNMAVANGRLYHGGLIARDAFNGLRLWERPLNPTPLRLGYPATALPASVQPVAAPDRVFVFTDKQVLALDATTGQTLRAYPDAGTPIEVLDDRGMLFAMARSSVRALDPTNGKLLWTAEGKEIDSLVTGDGGIFFLEGDLKRGDKRSVVCIDRGSGKERWRKTDYPWVPKVRRLSFGNGTLLCEVSTWTNDRPGNSVNALSARDGALLWQHPYEPGMSHYMQARAIQTADLVWVVTKDKWEGLDPKDGTVVKKRDATTGHCYPPVGTPRFLIAGEMGFTDLRTGKVDANRITKGHCSREAGFMPANGLLYVGPKHCCCWPMLRGYAALAPAHPTDDPASKGLKPSSFVPERGPAFEQAGKPAGQKAPHDEWPCYRADAWRSGSTAATVPADLEVLWTARLGGGPQGPLTLDWKDNLHSRGPLTPPVAADGLVVVARPEAHQVVALDAQSGQPRWDFTANGRVDTPPTLHGGLCLFGTRSGWVYCLSAADGKLVWRLRAGMSEERIVYFGQLESPWPVPGSVLVVNGVAYFAAGRHPLADGGILVFAVEPRTGEVQWVRRLNTLPMQSFYGGASLEFDAFDLLVAEAKRPDPSGKEAEPAADGPDFITLSRWRFAPRKGEMTAVWQSGFGYFRTGGCGVMAPRGIWTYGPRMDYVASGPQPGKPDYVHSTPRPLAVFRDSALFACSEDNRQLFRTDFSPELIAKFNDAWFAIGQIPRKKDQKGDRNRSERLAHDAKWTVDAFPDPSTSLRAGPKSQQAIGALVLAGETVFAVGQQGRLLAFAASDGKKLAERDLPAPIPDGLAAAYGKLFVATEDGDLICLGKR